MSDDVARMRALATQEQLQSTVIRLMQGTDVSGSRFMRWMA